MQNVCCNIYLESTDGMYMLRMSNVFVIDRILGNHQKPDVQRYLHLHEILVVKILPFQKVDIRIGQDTAEALVPIEV